MKLWEIKAQSLKLMFADSELEFSEDEFAEGSVYDNSNTREKLVRMEDSIRRGIDLYYVYVGVPILTAEFQLMTENVDGGIKYINKISVANKIDFGEPLKIEVFNYIERNGELVLYPIIDTVSFVYNPLAKEIWFYDNDFTRFEDRVVFRIWYKMKKLNIPPDANEMEFDLDSIYIPEGVQRMLPYFVKGEVYEEDEPVFARQARDEYIRYLISLPKHYSRVQTKVKRSKVFR